MLRWAAWHLVKGRMSFGQIVRAAVGLRTNYAIPESGNGQYIYALHDPFTRKVFYVGRTNNPGRRYVEHVNEWSKTDKSRYIQQLGQFNAVPFMTILEQCGSHNVNARERAWIKKFGGKRRLQNMTD